MGINPTTTTGQPSVRPMLLYGIPDAARALGIGQTYTWGLIRDRKLASVRIGRRTLIPVAALEAFAASLTQAR